MVDHKVLRDMVTTKDATKREIRESVSQLLDELGYKQTVLMTAGADEYHIRYR